MPMVNRKIGLEDHCVRTDLVLTLADCVTLGNALSSLNSASPMCSRDLEMIVPLYSEAQM